MLKDEMLMSRGMRCLIDNLGIIEAERFIALLSRERGDYTEWQREHYDNMSSEEFLASLEEFMRNHPDDSYVKARAK